MEGSFSNAGQEAQNVEKGVFEASLAYEKLPQSRKINFRVSTTNIRVTKELCKLTGYVAVGGVISLAALYGYAKIQPLLQNSINNTFDAENVERIMPNCLLVLICCPTDKIFIKILENYESGKITQGLEYEFLEIGIEVEGLMIKIENIEEVSKTKEEIYKTRKADTMTKGEEKTTKERDSCAAGDDERKLPTSKDEDTEVGLTTMFDPNPNSYNALCQATYIIEAMGHFLLISAEQDFSLSKNTEYSYIKYKDSFRACAAQVSKGVWESFHTAHNCMKQIHMKSVNIDKHLEKAAEVIEKGTKVELILAQLYLQKAEVNCSECADTARSITKAFDTVAKMMSELKQALMESKKNYKDEKQETNQKVQALNKEQKHRKHEKEEAKKRFEQKKRELEEADRNYVKAMDSFPSSLKIMLFRSIDGVADVSYDYLIQLLPQLVMGKFIATVPPATNQTAQESSTLAVPTTSVGQPNSSSENMSIQSQRTEISLTRTMLDNARKIQAEAKEFLQKRYESYELCYNEISEQSKKMGEVLQELAKFTQKDLDLDQIQEALRKSMDAICVVIEHWRELQGIFQVFNNAIKERLKADVGRFESVTAVAKNLPEDISKTSITFQMLIRESVEAKKIARVVMSKSSLYVKISETYLLDGLILLQRIDSLEPSTHREKMDEIRKKLQNGQKKARDGIIALAEENKRKLGESIKNLMVSTDDLEELCGWKSK